MATPENVFGTYTIAKCLAEKSGSVTQYLALPLNFFCHNCVLHDIENRTKGSTDSQLQIKGKMLGPNIHWLFKLAKL